MSKRKSTSEIRRKPKKVMTLAQKLEVLDKLDSGLSGAAVGRFYGVNESTIRSIKSKAKEIRASVAFSDPKSAKSAHVLRDEVMVKMEKALSMWIEGMNQKNTAVDLASIQAKALELYHVLKEKATDEGETTTKGTFTASRGWFDNFRKRFLLQNVSLRGDTASADHEDAEGHPGELQKRAEGKGYGPERVFNADKMAPWWKCVPMRTYISHGEKRASGFKAVKDRVTLLMCGSTAGNVAKSVLLYRIVKVPRETGGEGFSDMAEEEVADLLERKEITMERLEDLVQSESEESAEEKEDTESPIWTLEKMAEVMGASKALMDLLFKYDPSCERSNQVIRDIERALTPYAEIYRELKKAAVQVSTPMLSAQDKPAERLQACTSSPPPPCSQTPSPSQPSSSSSTVISPKEERTTSPPLKRSPSSTSIPPDLEDPSFLEQTPQN